MDVDRNLTPRRELDGVANQIHQDLTKTYRITNDCAWDFGADVKHHSKSLLARRRLKRLLDLLQEFPDRKRC